VSFWLTNGTAFHTAGPEGATHDLTGGSVVRQQALNQIDELRLLQLRPCAAWHLVERGSTKNRFFKSDMEHNVTLRCVAQEPSFTVFQAVKACFRGGHDSVFKVRSWTYAHCENPVRS